ncbi:hypothetical protein D3C85_1456490 [compost metagenome]
MVKGSFAFSAAALGLLYNVAVKTAVPIVIFILLVELVLVFSFPFSLFCGNVSLSLLQPALQKQKTKTTAITVSKDFSFIRYVLRLNIFNEFCRNPAHDSIIGNIFGNYGPCGDNGILSNGNAGQNRCIGTNPCIFFNVDRFSNQSFSLLWI